MRYITLAIASFWSFSISSQTLSEADLKTYIKSKLVTASPNDYYEYYTIYGEELMPSDIKKIYGFDIGKTLDDGLLIFSRLYDNKRDIMVKFDYIFDIRGASRIVIEDNSDSYDLKIFMQAGSFYKKHTYNFFNKKFENEPLINGFIPVTVSRKTDVHLLSKAILELRDVLHKKDASSLNNVMSTLNRSKSYLGRLEKDVLKMTSECDVMPNQENLTETTRFNCSDLYSFCSYNKEKYGICDIVGFEFHSRYKDEIIKSLNINGELTNYGKKNMSIISPFKVIGKGDNETADVYDENDSLSYFFWEVGATGYNLPFNTHNKSLLVIFNRKVEKPIISNRSIKMVKSSSGIYEIPVTLNNVLKINFIFDSGASDLSIPSEIAETLFKTNTITEADFLGTQKYVYADGSSETCKVYNIRSIEIGELTVKNVRASVSNKSAPLLLGQSVLQRFGKYTIDNKSHIVIFD